MGKPMSKRVLGAGYPLTVLDIRPEPVEELVREGARKAKNPKEVAEVSDMVLTSLPTLKACEDVYLGNDGLLRGARRGEILVETSTVPPALVRRFSDEGKKQGVIVIDAALQSRTLFHPEIYELKADEIAAKGKITVMVGGEADTLQKVKPVLETFGDPILHLGPVGSGVMTKVLGNAISHAEFVTVCEVIAIAAKAGLDLKKLLETLAKTGPRSTAVEQTIPKYLEAGKGRKMRTVAAVKDTESMLDLGRELGVPLLIHSITHAYYQSAEQRGFKDRPWDEILKLWEDFVGKPIKF